MKDKIQLKFNILNGAGLLILSILMLTDCSNESPEGEGSLKGKVTNKELGAEAIIYPAFIYLDDSLLAITNENGEYITSTLETGEYTLTCSALNYSNLIEKVKVVGGISTHNFAMTPDNTTGKLVGEFQDLNAFNDSIISNPDLADWDEQKIYDAATGATIQLKWFPELQERCTIYLGNDSIGSSDGFGQYGFILQCGTYSITGACKGYQSKTQVVTITPDSKILLNFMLERE